MAAFEGFEEASGRAHGQVPGHAHTHVQMHAAPHARSRGESCAEVPLGDLSLHLLFRLAAGAALLAALMSVTGCGGGGGSSGGAAPVPVPAPPPPAPSPAPIAAQLSVPAPVGYDADRLAAFNRLNEIRLSAGLGMLAQSAAMDQAAQAHAAWIVANDMFTHDEQAGSVGLTGANWAQRDEAFGYVPVGGAEVIVAPAHGAAGVDTLINMVYHRADMLAFEPVDVGVGWSSLAAAAVAMPLVIDMSSPAIDSTRALGQSPQAIIGGVCVWPLDGAQGVPTRLGLEIPDPVPSQDVSTLGTPASLGVAGSKTVQASSFVMTATLTGAVVPTRMLTNQNDPNFVLPQSFVALVPLAALVPNTSYSVAFTGSAVSFPSGDIEAINRTWSFTTGGQ